MARRPRLVLPNNRGQTPIKVKQSGTDPQLKD